MRCAMCDRPVEWNAKTGKVGAYDVGTRTRHTATCRVLTRIGAPTPPEP